MMIPLQMPPYNGFPWFQSGAKRISSIHSSKGTKPPAAGPSTARGPTSATLVITTVVTYFLSWLSGNLVDVGRGAFFLAVW